MERQVGKYVVFLDFQRENHSCLLCFTEGLIKISKQSIQCTVCTTKMHSAFYPKLIIYFQDNDNNNLILYY